MADDAEKKDTETKKVLHTYPLVRVSTYYQIVILHFNLVLYLI